MQIDTSHYFQDIKDMVKGPVDFETPICAKRTPHDSMILIHRVELSPEGDIWLTTGEGTFQLEETDRNADIMITSVRQRLWWMKHEKKI
jgi:hypothetical protein